ncbi:MAG: LysM peptidoglycan-binding domain-containing protein [Clostridiales bacterium]|nr:LysM peptidoglycan-binding domain-containing protein [Clostridiales bacterium]
MKHQKIGRILLPISLSLLLSGFSIPNHSRAGGNFNSAIVEEKENLPVYSVYINDQNIGAVKFPAHGLWVYDRVIEDIKEKYEDSATFEADIHFKEITSGNVLKDEDLAEAIEDAVQVKMMAYGINIDGTTACYLKTGEEADQVLEMIKAPYREDIEQREDAYLEAIEVKEEIQFTEELVLYQDIIDIDTAFQVITQGPDSHRTYLVEEGDTLWSIAMANDTTVSELEVANPDIEGDIIKPGQELKLVAPKNLITVITKEKVKKIEEIEFEEETRKVSTLYKGQSKLVQEGENGEKEIEYLIIRENGSEKEREIVKEVVIKEPINQITEEGTKSKPVYKPKDTKKTTSRSSSNSSSSSSSSKDYTPIVRNGVEMTPWFGGAENIFTRGSTAKVTHVDTGRTFYVKRRGGTKHADCEPLTKNDTDIMRQIYGGSWSWNRKAIIVEVNGKKMAASMNGMPHGGSSISNNGFSGHFCIHFYGSRGHSSNRQDSDHQAMVKRAMGM